MNKNKIVLVLIISAILLGGCRSAECSTKVEYRHSLDFISPKVMLRISTVRDVLLKSISTNSYYVNEIYSDGAHHPNQTYADNTVYFMDVKSPEDAYIEAKSLTVAFANNASSTSCFYKEVPEALRYKETYAWYEIHIPSGTVQQLPESECKCEK